jgi:membrane protein YqaA with SNARE-associated domain
MLAAVLATAATAVLSAFVPAMPIEPYLVGLVATSHYHPVPLGIAAAVGQTFGKLLIFPGTRGAVRSSRMRRWGARAARRFTRPRCEPPAAPTPRSWAVRWWRASSRPVVAAGRRLTALLDRPLLTAPIVFVSAAAGVPPLLVTSVYAARTPISVLAFTLACLLGRSVRFVALASVPLLVADG